tara:strand:- start:85 stop:480 length:396 start_codon:yes stop_codon:yes gene_type:complete
MTCNCKNKRAPILFPTEQQITEKYINKVLPLLVGEDDGEVGFFYSNGRIAYRFPCSFCQPFYDSKKIRNNQMGEIFLSTGMKYSSTDWCFRCRRRGSLECRGGTKSFYNFLAMFNPTLFDEYKQELIAMFK